MERKSRINNDFYDELAEKWYTAFDHPIALLRAENAVRIPWILGEIGEGKTVLDLGCGAGLLTNAFAERGHSVFGIDLSPKSLEIAKQYDRTQKVSYQVAHAYSLPYPDGTFDVVCAMDVLEHVEEPNLLLAEASRVLKPGGLFFFHTFNRNPLSYLLVIKGVDWCVPNAPKNMHLYSLFIKPRELKEMCFDLDLHIVEWYGFNPKIFGSSLLKMVFSRRVPPDFGFSFSKRLVTGYCGYAQKKESSHANAYPQRKSDPHGRPSPLSSDEGSQFSAR